MHQCGAAKFRINSIRTRSAVCNEWKHVFRKLLRLFNAFSAFSHFLNVFNYCISINLLHWPRESINYNYSYVLKMWIIFFSKILLSNCTYISSLPFIRMKNRRRNLFLHVARMRRKIFYHFYLVFFHASHSVVLFCLL